MAGAGFMGPLLNPKSFHARKDKYLPQQTWPLSLYDDSYSLSTMQNPHYIHHSFQGFRSGHLKPAPAVLILIFPLYWINPWKKNNYFIEVCWCLMRIHINKEDINNALTQHCPTLVSFCLEQLICESRQNYAL